MMVAMVAGMVWVLGHGDQERGEQWLVLVMGGVRELQGSRDGQPWTWSRCLVKCPQEKKFQIFENPLVDLKHIIIEMEWWWWWSIW
jgi:hypothetical protein